MATRLTTRRFTVDEYHRMAEAGILTEADRVELVDGHIVPMTPIGRRHAGCVNRLNQLFSPLARGLATLSVQNPLLLGEHQEPQPDFTVLRYRADGYGAALPRAGDVLLVIEVADTSAQDDRDRKIPLYARAGVPEAWLVDLPDDAIEVCRDPTPDGYREVRRLERGASVTPLQVPGVTLAVADVLGPRP